MHFASNRFCLARRTASKTRQIVGYTTSILASMPHYNSRPGKSGDTEGFASSGNKTHGCGSVRLRIFRFPLPNETRECQGGALVITWIGMLPEFPTHPGHHKTRVRKSPGFLTAEGGCFCHEVGLCLINLICTLHPTACAYFCKVLKDGERLPFIKDDSSRVTADKFVPIRFAISA